MESCQYRPPALEHSRKLEHSGTSKPPTISGSNFTTARPQLCVRPLDIFAF